MSTLHDFLMCSVRVEVALVRSRRVRRLHFTPLNEEVVMSRLLCIGMAAALTCACGHSDNRTAENTAADTAAPAPGATGSSGAVATSGSNQTIVLTGCLQRTNASQPVDPDFILAHATAGAPDAADQPTGTSGVGNSGAGASG